MRLALNQEKIVFGVFLVCFLYFAFALPGFASPENIISLVRSVSVLGILGVGMAIVIIGRGIDLSIVATMAMSMALSLQLAHNGLEPSTAFAVGLGFAVLVGLINGWLIAYADIPALFSTLAMGSVVYGVGRYWFIDQDILYLPANSGAMSKVGGPGPAGIPYSILIFAALAIIAALLLRYTKIGRFIYLVGDNPAAARITGLAVRPLIVLQYVIATVVAFCAGLIMTSAVGSINTRIVNSTMIYDIILVVVLGGIGLSGGRGNIRNVIVGTLLIGTILNGMTIMNLPYTTQNLIKSMILLFAIVIDSFVNPQDEQTARQGDI